LIALETRLQHQIARLDRRIAYLTRIADRLSWLRLTIFIAGCVLSVSALAITAQALAFFVTALVSIVIFFYVVRLHGQVMTAIAGLNIWKTIKTAHLSRLRLDWTTLPPTPLTADHPLAIDLDLLGERSLHRLIDMSVTREGCARLRDWLIMPDLRAETIQGRATRVKELIRHAHFRDKLAFRSKMALPIGQARWRSTRVQNWFSRNVPLESYQPTLKIALGLSVVNIVLGLLYVLHILPPIVLITFLVYWGVLSLHRDEDAEDPLDLITLLETLGSVFNLLERVPLHDAPGLESLCAPFRDRANAPSTQLRRAVRIVSALSIAGSPLVGLLINTLVPWNLYFSYRLARVRQEIAARMPSWIDIWAELEALSSLAVLGWLNPDYTFPVLGATLLEARQIGHPLIPTAARIANDFQIAALGQVIVITGSNMSGKSTFLRTLGVNLCLAYAGGPVCAAQMNLSLMRLMTCIRVSDSLAEGFSYFYAEVRRLRDLLTALEIDNPLPLFFLIDEIFRGTNNQERLIGSRAYIRALTGKQGTGVISTHDLELVKLANDTPLINNLHFREDVIDGQLIFDYKLHPGPSPTTNALKIMALAGLPVET
jgi:hypothetical protein